MFSRCELDLWHFTLNICSTLGVTSSVCIKYEWNWTICGEVIDDFANFHCRYVVHCDLLTFNVCSTSSVMCSDTVQNFTKLNNPWPSNLWVTAVLLSNSGALTSRRLSGVCRPNCTKFGKDTGPSPMSTELLLEFRYLAPFQNTSVTKASGIEKWGLCIVCTSL